MEPKQAIPQLQSAGRKAAMATIAGGGGPTDGLAPINPSEAQDRFLRSLAELKSRERPTIRAIRWTGALRDPIRIPSCDTLEFLYGPVPTADREWFHVHEARINKLELLRAQLGVETWWEVALWFAKREVPGFKIAPKNSKRRSPWRTLRVQLYVTVNALMDEHEDQPKAIERAIAKLKKFDAALYGRCRDATLRKQYYLAKKEVESKGK